MVMISVDVVGASDGDGGVSGEDARMGWWRMRDVGRHGEEVDVVHGEDEEPMESCSMGGID